MRLFVLDENGNVVFEFNTDGNHHLDSSKAMQAKVIKMILEALQFVGRRP